LENDEGDRTTVATDRERHCSVFDVSFI